MEGQTASRDRLSKVGGRQLAATLPAQMIRRPRGNQDSAVDLGISVQPSLESGSSGERRSSIVKKKSHALKKIKVMLNRVGRPDSSIGSGQHEA